MQRCKRCNKPLKDKESIERGYGPGCWEKIQAGETKIAYMRKHPEIYDIVQAINSRFKLEERIRALQLNCSCGESLDNGMIKSYDHSNGVKAAGYTNAQWFYVHCSCCGHDTALSKLNINMFDLADQKNNLANQEVSI